jgi:hypothetical protein
MDHMEQGLMKPYFTITPENMWRLKMQSMGGVYKVNGCLSRKSNAQLRLFLLEEIQIHFLNTMEVKSVVSIFDQVDLSI